MSTKVSFLDSDIQIHRKSLDPKVALHCEDFVSKLGFTMAAAYSRLEFKRAFLVHLAYLQRKIDECKSLTATLNVVLELTPHHDRKLKMAARAVGYLVSQLKSQQPLTDEVEAERACLILENLVESYWDWFDEGIGIDAIVNKTGCVRAAEAPRIRGGLLDVAIAKCKPSSIKCKINSFFDEESARFEQVKKQIDSLGADKSTELTNHSKIITEAKEDSRCLADDQKCRKLADSLIAVECASLPKTPAVFVSSNGKEHRHTTKALGLVLELYEAPRGVQNEKHVDSEPSNDGQ